MSMKIRNLSSLSCKANSLSRDICNWVFKDTVLIFVNEICFSYGLEKSLKESLGNVDIPSRNSQPITLSLKAGILTADPVRLFQAA